MDAPLVMMEKKIASVSTDGTVMIWDMSTGKCITSLRLDGRLSACAWFPDNEQLVAVGRRGVYFLTLMMADRIS